MRYSLHPLLSRRFAFAAVVLFCSLIRYDPSFSQWSSNSQTNNPVAVLPGTRQFSPAITRDSERGVVIVWTDNGNGNLDIYSLRINEAGQLSSSAASPVAVAANDQEKAALTTGNDGSIFIAWQDNRVLTTFKEIRLQRLSLDGSPIWPQAAIAHSRNNFAPIVFTNSFAEVITSAYTTGLFDDVISVQVTDSNGNVQFQPQEILNESARGMQPNQPPAVVPALQGGVLGVWVDTRQDTVIFVKGLHRTGTFWAAGEVLIAEEITPQSSPLAASDGNEGAIIVWLAPLGPEQSDIVLAARIDQSGGFVWSPISTEVKSLGGYKQLLEITTDGSGGAFLVWENVATLDPKIYLQRIFADGQTWPFDVEVSQTISAQNRAKVINNGAGAAIVAWEDRRNGHIDLFAQLVDSTGARQWNADGVAVSTATGDQSNVVLTPDGLGGAILAWEDRRSGLDPDIYAQRVSKPGTLGEFRTVSVSAPVSDADWEIGSSQTIRWNASPEIANVKIELSRDGGNSFSTLIPTTSNPTNGEGSATLSSVTGPASSQARIRISAVEAPFILGISNRFTITTEKGPELQVQTVPQSSIGDTIVVVTNATDVSGIQDLFLYFRSGGAARFDSLRMDFVESDRFQAGIPADFVTERGIEYFIQGTDGIGQVSITDTLFAAVNFASDVEVANITAGSVQNAYRMISAPNLLEEQSVDEVLAASGFGVYDTTSWRLFDYRGTSYVERDSGSVETFVFAPGKAYWLISAKSRRIDFGAGQSLSSRSPAIINLLPGWNQVGQPYAFPVAWAAILEASGNPQVQGPFLFSGDYALAETVDPYSGYFVFNAGQQNVTLAIPGVEASQLPALSKNDRASGSNWELTIAARCEEARDEFNKLGIHNDAQKDWDLMDLPEPPPIGEYISVYFPRPDWQLPNLYTTDYRAELADGQSWSFVVKTNIKNSEATIRFESIEEVPVAVELMLFDDRLNIAQNLRKEASYSFSTGPHGSSKELRIAVGSSYYIARETAGAQLVPEDFELSQNFPNPFNPSTTIRYGLPHTAKVHVRIFDVLGKEVITLVDGESQAPGFHVLNWNGRDRNGTSVASGLYIYQLSADRFIQTRKMLLVK